MRAVFFEKHGGPEVLQVGERPMAPEPGGGEIRLRVRAAALNHLDLFVRDGIPNVAVPLPHIPGADAAGEVDRCGPGVVEFTAGDRVLVQPGVSDGVCEFCLAGEQSLCRNYQILGEHRSGTFAEWITLPARNVFAIPKTFSFEEAAAFPLVFQTAGRMVVGGVRGGGGETVLIQGVGGGVAGAALQ